MPDAGLPGLLVDYGGVLTSNVFAAFGGFCVREGLDTDVVRRAFREDVVARELLFELELGRLDEAEFSRRFAVALGLGEGRSQGLIERLWADLGPDDEMIEAVAGFHAAGVRTGLISNSWGTALKYEEELMTRLFDVLVISHLEGIRKPDPAMYALGAERLGLEPQQCVFVDDLPGNLKPARAMGMTTVHHTTAAETVPQLEELLGVTVRA
ncbi:MAG: putative hydrolase of the superfamily [Solirubrobacteraceae bacterium]|nr:putative hydrolase of the superfamily [Solirubrobacteraceae bacterium]